MYVASDPRSQLAAAAPAAPKPATSFGPSYYANFYETEPQEVKPGERSWYARAENALIAYSLAEAGAEFERKGQVDEYVLYLPDHATEVEVTARGETKKVQGFTLTFIPAGDSTIRVKTGGAMVRMFTTRSADLVAKCVNSPSYRNDPNVPALENWPEPATGFKIRSYQLDIPPKQGRFGRIFRCTTFMVNIIYPTIGRRPANAMSPHSHDDFQQISLSIEGSWIHHLRWPWSTDLTQWTNDEHQYSGSPSVAVLPAQVIHTSEANSSARNTLVDIFCPPRLDFSKLDGWVLNGDDYPMPD